MRDSKKEETSTNLARKYSPEEILDILNQHLQRTEKTQGLAQEFSAEQILDIFIHHLKEEHNYKTGEIQKLLKKEIAVPLTIFEKKLSALEAIVKYLKEELNLRNKEIAELLNRKPTTIWTTYNNAIKKKKERFGRLESEIKIPIRVLGNRKLSILEAIVVYLLEKGMRFNEIAGAMHRSESTIRTVYARSKRK